MDDDGQCLVSWEVVVENVGSADCDFKSRCVGSEQQNYSWRKGRVPLKGDSYLESSLVDGGAIRWEVRSVGLDLVVQHYRSNTSTQICPDKLALTDTRNYSMTYCTPVPDRLSLKRFRCVSSLCSINHATVQVGEMALLVPTHCGVHFLIQKRD
jgi:hypothetical protein